MIEIDNISYSYEDSGRAALSGVTLSIKKVSFLQWWGITAAENPRLQNT